MSLSRDLLYLIARSPTLFLSLRNSAILNDIISTGAATADDVANMITMAYNINPSATINIFSDQRITGPTAAAIFGSNYIQPSTIAPLANVMPTSAATYALANIPTSKAASILNDPNMPASTAVAILANSNLSATKGYSILANANMPGNTAQQILYNIVANYSVSRAISLMTAGAQSVTLSASATYNGVNVFNSLTTGSYTYTADGQPHILIAGTLTVSSGGAISKTATGAAGPSAGNGTGGGFLIILTNSLNNSGTISANGVNGNVCGGGTTVGGTGTMLVVGSDVPGNGGSGGATI